MRQTRMYYYGARYYAAWICRFVSVDPMKEERIWLTLYNYVQNNPINRVDPTGMVDEEPPKGANPELYGESGEESNGGKLNDNPNREETSSLNKNRGGSVKNAHYSDLIMMTKKLKNIQSLKEDFLGSKTKQDLKNEGRWRGEQNKKNRKVIKLLNDTQKEWDDIAKKFFDSAEDIKQLKMTQPLLFEKLNKLPVNVCIGRSDSFLVSENGGAVNEFSIKDGKVSTYIDLDRGVIREGITIWSDSNSLSKLYHEAGHVVSYFGGIPELDILGFEYGTKDMPADIVDLRIIVVR